MVRGMALGTVVILACSRKRLIGIGLLLNRRMVRMPKLVNPKMARPGATCNASLRSFCKSTYLAILLSLPLSAATTVERWGLFEVALQGPTSGNPFLDVRLSARFRYRNRAVDV